MQQEVIGGTGMYEHGRGCKVGWVSDAGRNIELL